jgi:hypothetical protein
MKSILSLVAGLFLVASVPAAGQIVFFDDFEDGADPAWGNEFGDWIAIDGVYTSTIQSNNPPTYTSVTFLPELTDFTIDLDINGVRDGGVFLRSHLCENGLVDGVILVVGGYGGTYNGCYWHTSDCNGYSPATNHVDIPGLQGSDVHLRIEVSGNLYRAFLGDETEPITTLETELYPSGGVALYEFLDQSFDNVAINPATTGAENNALPARDKVVSIHPNPFNPSTRISLIIDQAQNVELAVFDLTGKRIAILADRWFETGGHSLGWDGRDLLGHAVASGTYLLRMVNDEGVASEKMMLVR